MKKKKRPRQDARGLCLRKGDIPPQPITTEELRGDEGLTRSYGELFHRLSLRSFGALGDLKFDLVAFSQGFEARGVDRGVAE